MTISEVCQKFGVSQDTLRYYERNGLIPKIKRNAGGFREYSEEDLAWVEGVICLRGAGMSVESIAEYAALVRQGDEALPARKAIIVEQRDALAAKIEALQASLAQLNEKIDKYDTMTREHEKKMQRALEDEKG